MWREGAGLVGFTWRNRDEVDLWLYNGGVVVLIGKHQQQQLLRWRRDIGGVSERQKALFTQDAHGQLFAAALLYGPLKFALEIRHTAANWLTLVSSPLSTRTSSPPPPLARVTSSPV